MVINYKNKSTGQLSLLVTAMTFGGSPGISCAANHRPADGEGGGDWSPIRKIHSFLVDQVGPSPMHQLYAEYTRDTSVILDRSKWGQWSGMAAEGAPKNWVMV